MQPGGEAHCLWVEPSPAPSTFFAHNDLYSPSDAAMTSRLAEASYNNEGPSYVRIEKGVVPAIYDADDSAIRDFETLRSCRGVTIVSTGLMVHRARKITDALTESGINA